MHYLASSEDGPIVTERRVEAQRDQEAVICPGGRYAVACQPRRTYLARGTGTGLNFKLTEPFHATGQIFRVVKVNGQEVLHNLVTCQRCRNSPLYRRDVEAQKAAFGPVAQEV
jgi:hypothetical protein